MRTAEEIQKQVMETAIADNRIRAVLLNGSRANPRVSADKFQDFDIVFIVRNLSSFTSNHSWVNALGEPFISQLPDEMILEQIGNDNTANRDFHYLMLFRDGNRIDLTLFPIEHINSRFVWDSLTLVWLDKDNLFPNIAPPTDKDYHIRRPTEAEFLVTCNEFCWVSTYVVKGLMRKEITYAKEMLETIVRPEFMKMVGWYIGTETNFAVSMGKGGKYMAQYLSDVNYNKILATYSDAQIEKNWDALLLMEGLFREFAIVVAERLHFKVNLRELHNTSDYLKVSYGARQQ